MTWLFAEMENIFPFLAWGFDGGGLLESGSFLLASTLVLWLLFLQEFLLVCGLFYYKKCYITFCKCKVTSHVACNATLHLQNAMEFTVPKIGSHFANARWHHMWHVMSPCIHRMWCNTFCSVGIPCFILSHSVKITKRLFTENLYFTASISRMTNRNQSERKIRKHKIKWFMNNQEKKYQHYGVNHKNNDNLNKQRCGGPGCCAQQNCQNPYLIP
jgi:hypothetical protein